MTAIRTIIATVAVVASLATAAQAADTLKPLQGISYHAGSKHAVGYFLTEKSGCNLVLTLADDANYAPTRHETAIRSGASTRYEFAEGKALEFSCQATGQVMTIDTLQTVAAN